MAHRPKPPIPNPQSPIPNPQSPLKIEENNIKKYLLNLIKKIKLKLNI
jgi:hypothetical protein